MTHQPSSAGSVRLPDLDKVIAALKIGDKILGPDEVDLAAAAWLERLHEELESAKAQITIALKSNGFQLLGMAIPDVAAEASHQSAPLEPAPQKTAERMPSSDAASGGADTIAQGQTEPHKKALDAAIHLINALRSGAPKDDLEEYEKRFADKLLLCSAATSVAYTLRKDLLGMLDYLENAARVKATGFVAPEVKIHNMHVENFAAGIREALLLPSTDGGSAA